MKHANNVKGKSSPKKGVFALILLMLSVAALVFW